MEGLCFLSVYSRMGLSFHFVYVCSSYVCSLMGLILLYFFCMLFNDIGGWFNIVFVIVSKDLIVYVRGLSVCISCDVYLLVCLSVY